MSYRAPTEDIVFTLTRIAAPHLDPEDIRAIVEEAGRFARDKVAPLDRVSDLVGATWRETGVTTPPGFRDIYRDWREAGWNALAQPENFGGSGLPTVLGAVSTETLASACMAFATLPTITRGAADALHTHASDELKALYLPKLVSGQWTGTMNLTEPQAGSDLALLRARAVPAGDGSWRLTGQKIFITFGEHDMAENIVHLVLARLPDAPPGIKGLSLFLAPKFLVDADGNLGERNDLRCAGIEHKLGIKGSPTCTMIFGENGGAKAWLVGRENEGLACMFTMMNKARLDTGIQGVSMAEKATQRALAYALERRQGRAAGFDSPAPIAAHPDMGRMLARMRALTAATRAIAYCAAAAIDQAERGDDAEARRQGELRAGLLTPVVKAFSTDIGCEVASLCVQVHGGMGFVEETGVAQFYRDIRIAPIYEGTNAIQATDLVMRKIGRDQGEDLRKLIAESRADVAAAETRIGAAAAGRLRDALAAWEQASAAALAADLSDTEKLLVASTYLRLFGLALGGALLCRGAAAAGAGEDHWVGLARVFADDIAPECQSLAAQIVQPKRDIEDYRVLAGLR
ncbi:acyl-CoA dehydrogenase [Rhodoblastus sphagnicola]|uniref:3-methylmercaptopropionyl-CoA dehydrogenase n=1 Tax=Rhodoblastus sphagnicola TaxID=333368 RepID=A0A2S6NG32_9HYPH|nr:acyl-CoA dehydrogenase family protein [Rhodoblastus sphagnicola]MBB4199483.1 alkylation response protein AidB-like acyl-CoA dehydrogenase [Rhodoblastus sphagnicola]PPQ33550.1 acyl-CoA dehydrogenase [Rhodoblastus sphagnicola]